MSEDTRYKYVHADRVFKLFVLTCQAVGTVNKYMYPGALIPLKDIVREVLARSEFDVKDVGMFGGVEDLAERVRLAIDDSRDRIHTKRGR